MRIKQTELIPLIETLNFIGYEIEKPEKTPIHEIIFLQQN